ncbi:hypothetical protein POM88_000238 [Heracleum sosnowskyi]|uniref:Uncharacterized protein n=1 Tax=Heracleum sosnowskyi TaxID=360622 RepID=A0AAD8JCM2_9APIA|nr:hypothetical protein POM88_000238 [Heracleum sosnowskyi]
MKLPFRFRASSQEMEECWYLVTEMFWGVGSARILTLDLETIKALSAVLDFLVKPPPKPFYNLKYLKVPQGYRETSMSTRLKSCLFGRSPKATVVTTLPQENMIPGTEAAFVSAQCDSTAALGSFYQCVVSYLLCCLRICRTFQEESIGFIQAGDGNLAQWVLRNCGVTNSSSWENFFSIDLKAAARSYPPGFTYTGKYVLRNCAWRNEFYSWDFEIPELHDFT